MLLVDIKTLEDSSPARATHRQSKSTDNVSLDEQLQVADATTRHRGRDPHNRQATWWRIRLGVLGCRVDQAPTGQRVS